MEHASSATQRQTQAADTSSLPPESHKTADTTAQIDPDKETRRERNRYHARVSRERRRNHERVLQEALTTLQQENEDIALANEKLTHMVLGDLPSDTQNDINELAQQNLSMQLMMFRMIGPTLDQQLPGGTRQAWQEPTGSEGIRPTQQYYYSNASGQASLPTNPSDGPTHQYNPGSWNTTTPPPNPKQSGR